MLPRSIFTFLALLCATAAAGNKGSKSTRRHPPADNYGVKKILIGGGPSGTISIADFDGSNLNIVANNTIAGTSASWLLFKQPNLLYAVDENSNTTRLFNVSWSRPHIHSSRETEKGLMIYIY